MRVNEANPELVVVTCKERCELGKYSVALNEPVIGLANLKRWQVVVHIDVGVHGGSRGEATGMIGNALAIGCYIYYRVANIDASTHERSGPQASQNIYLRYIREQVWKIQGAGRFRDYHSQDSDLRVTTSVGHCSAWHHPPGLERNSGLPVSQSDKHNDTNLMEGT